MAMKEVSDPIRSKMFKLLQRRHMGVCEVQAARGKRSVNGRQAFES
jgi:hypothetical protein